jgi:hypothetical protein
MEKLSLEIKKINQKMVSIQDEYGKKCEESESLQAILKKM